METIVGRNIEMIPAVNDQMPALHQIAADRIIGLAVHLEQTGELGLILADAVFTEVVVITVDDLDASQFDTVDIITVVDPSVGDNAVSIELAVELTVKQLAADAGKDAVNILVAVAGGEDLSTPVHHGLTGLAVGAVLIASGGAGGFLVQDGQLGIVVVPGVDVVVEVGLNGHGTTERSSAVVSEGDLAVDHIAADLDDGAIAGCKLGLGSDGFTGDIVDTVPAPDTDGQTHQSLGTGQSGVTHTLDGDGQLVGDLVEAVLGLEALGDRNTLGLPGVGSL